MSYTSTSHVAESLPPTPIELPPFVTRVKRALQQVEGVRYCNTTMDHGVLIVQVVGGELGEVAATLTQCVPDDHPTSFHHESD